MTPSGVFAFSAGQAGIEEGVEPVRSVQRVCGRREVRALSQALSVP